jgi:hypothetical protein
MWLRLAGQNPQRWLPACRLSLSTSISPFGREPSPEMMCPVNQRSMIAYSAVQREIGFNDRPRLTGGPA